MRSHPLPRQQAPQAVIILLLTAAGLCDLGCHVAGHTTVVCRIVGLPFRCGQLRWTLLSHQWHIKHHMKICTMHSLVITWENKYTSRLWDLTFFDAVCRGSFHIGEIFGPSQVDCGKPLYIAPFIGGAFNSNGKFKPGLLRKKQTHDSLLYKQRCQRAIFW